MARWYSCNVLERDANAQRLWQFDGHSFGLNREVKLLPSESLPATLAGKSWSALWQPRMNVAWLPPADVFIRVAQFPPSTPEETRSMVELQLEKLSPIPVTQAVWTMHVLQPSAAPSAQPADPESAKMQTLLVTIVPRNAVEEFLGELEGRGYLADRLEVPAVDQLQATVVKEDGAWVYPAPGANTSTALVAWWYGGVLRNVALISLPEGQESVGGIQDQLMQMSWGGELEGWLTSPPFWHLVADPAVAQHWEPLLRKVLEQPIEIVQPLSDAALAALTARRATRADSTVNLLPAEFAARYRQKFVDRLWLHGLVAVLGLYFVGCMVYFVALWFLSYQTSGVETQLGSLNGSYTNALQIKARYEVLKDRQDLKYAALDCWEAVAELIPEGTTLETMNFSEGRKLSLSGSAPASQVNSVFDFSSKLRKYVKNGQPLFSTQGVEEPQAHVNPANATASWSFGLTLKRAEAP